jgi:uncharacterized protein YgfB (UPF0149 family)
MSLPDYIEVEEALSGGGSMVSASECHGVLCGILCASGSSDMQGWVRHLFEARAEKKEISAQALKTLHDVHQVTVNEINHETLEFSLLLPDGAQPIDSRIGALADWCGGFSLGLSMGGLQDRMLLNDDVREFVEDVQYISDASFSSEGDSEEHTEQSLVEIEEYLRMGVLLLNEELQPLSASPTIH